MIPNIGSTVKVYFKGGLVDQGVVDSWDENEAVLRSSHSYSLINNLDEIILIKVYEDRKEETASEVFVDKELEPQEYHREHIDRALELAELHKLKAEEERKRAREKLTEFKPSANLGTTYDNYSILTDESILHNPSEED